MKPPPQFIFLDADNVFMSFNYDLEFHQMSERTGISVSHLKEFYITKKPGTSAHQLIRDLNLRDIRLGI